MSDWESVTDVTCTCGFVYLSSQDYCPDCCYPTDVNQFDMAKKEVFDEIKKKTLGYKVNETITQATTTYSSGLLTAVPDFSNEIPVKIGKTPKRGGSQAWWYKGARLDSTNEKDRFLFLEVLEERGVISGLDRQFKVKILQPETVFATPFFDEFTQDDEAYTVDFIYVYKGFSIYEDAKASRFTPKKKLLKPRVKASGATKAKRLQSLIAKTMRNVFIYSVFHKGTWHYFNTMLKESEISLE